MPRKYTPRNPLYATKEWKRLRLVILERDGHQCQIKGKLCKGVADAVDHILTLDQRPDLALDPSNLRAACRPCNSSRNKLTYFDEGWKGANLPRITLVVGPQGSGHGDYVRGRAGPEDLLVDFVELLCAMSPAGPPPLTPASQQHGQGVGAVVAQTRAHAVTLVRRGRTAGVGHVWITSSDRTAPRTYPHHELVWLGAWGAGHDDHAPRAPRVSTPPVPGWGLDSSIAPGQSIDGAGEVWPW